MRQRNSLAQSLTDSRQHLRQFWRDAWTSFKQGRWHRLDVTRSLFHLTEEGALFLSFSSAFFSKLAGRLFGNVIPLRR